MAENFRFICEDGVLSGAEGAVPEVLTVPGEINGERVCSWGYILERYEQPDYDERRGEVFIRTEVRRVSRPLSGMEGVKHLILPTGLNNISDDAFSSLSSLETVTGGGRDVRVEGGCVIDFTNKLILALGTGESLTVPPSVKELAPRCFMHFKGKKVIFTAPCVARTDAYGRFGPFSQSGVEEVVLPAGATALHGLLKGAECLKRVEIPEGVRAIHGLFDGCRQLTEIALPGTVTSIGSDAFHGCHALRAVTLAEGVTEIQDRAFEGCASLTHVEIPDTVKEIGKCAFKYCSNLKKAVLPACASLGWEAFRYCGSLESVKLPDTLTSIASYTFEKCTALCEIVIPDGVRTVGEKAFFGCTALKDVRLPKSLKSLGASAFEGCDALESIVLPKGVEWIYECALFLVQKVFYEGSEAEYRQINVSFGNSKKETYFYTETAPEVAGKYWHYIDGQPAIW